MRFLDHFKVGEPIAGDNIAGILVGADELGIYFDMADGGITFLNWKAVGRIWNGPPAERAIRHRNERRIDHEVSDEQMRKALDAAYDVLKNGDPTCRPALSEDEIRELMERG